LIACRLFPTCLFLSYFSPYDGKNFPGTLFAGDFVGMKIAIVLFENKVSPRFDLSPKLWIIREENGEVVHQEKISLEGLTIRQRIEKLNSSGITKLICGGIHDFSLNQLMNMGIEVFHNVMGEADTALKTFLKGKLESGSYCEKEKMRNLGGPQDGGEPDKESFPWLESSTADPADRLEPFVFGKRATKASLFKEKEGHRNFPGRSKKIK
jgi:predicted Fe-Mo cluster-binding NifX family protein